MKHSVLFFSLTVVLVTMGIIITQIKENPSGRLLSVTQYYSFLYDKDTSIEIPLYVNESDSPLLNTNSYESIALMDGEGMKKLDVELSNISLGSIQPYLNEMFYEFILKIPFPDLGEDFWIDDLWLEIHLINDDAYQISLGSLSVMDPQSNIGNLEWSSLEGTKGDDALISRLHQIEITYEHLQDNIAKVEIGKDASVSFQVNQTKIVLTIPEKDALLFDVPILIYFEDGSRQDIFNFRYMIEYDMLSENGLVIHSYATH